VKTRQLENTTKQMYITCSHSMSFNKPEVESDNLQIDLQADN